MKKSNVLSIAIIGLIMLSVSCSKDNPTTSGTGGSGNTCSSNYLPYRVGTKVDLKDASGNASSFSIIKDTTVNGIYITKF